MEDELEDEKLNTKHYRIRGTHDLKYPPNESRCHNTCGHYHDVIHPRSGEKVLQHRCFLSISHQGYCEFSSACGELRVRSSVGLRRLTEKLPVEIERQRG